MMKFSDLDTKLRIYETASDTVVLPGIHIVARLDGRSFSRLTKEVHKFEAPFDAYFRDCMVTTTEHLMNCGFRILFGYTQSDEISLLLHRDEGLFDRKLRKLLSVLAGEASSAFTLELGAKACFDCRICQLPNKDLVVEYFRWRQEDATRNALNAYSYWTLRKEGSSAADATNALLTMSVAAKNELLFARGINFADVPLWQKRGIGLQWAVMQQEGTNRKTGEPAPYSRRRLQKDFELPMKDAYNTYLRNLMKETPRS